MTKKAVVVDTNVAVTANGQADHATEECQLKCIEKLHKIIDNNIVVIDDNYLILEEYRKRLSYGDKRVGDAFYKHVFNYMGNPEYVERVSITLKESGDIEEFPKDERLSRFDFDDRKFIAVSCVHPSFPPVLNAVDSDYSEYRDILRQCGITVIFVCEE